MPNFTKNAIKQAFIKLLDERPLKQITVRDIVEECGINRNTFYYHFSDIPTLTEEIMMEEATQIIEKYPNVDSIETCLQALTDFAHQNKRAIFHIYHSVNREMYEHYLWEVCETVVTTYTETLLRNHTVNEDDRRILIQFYKCTCFGLITEWIRTGMHANIEQDLHRLCELRKGIPEEIISRCECRTEDSAT